MEIILLEKVENLGGLGDKVNVRPGYARNYLIPQGKATEANADNLAAFEARRAELEQKEADVLAGARARRELLDGLTVSVAARAGSEGKLFGSVGPAEIARAVAEAGQELARQEVRIAEPIRQLGEFDVDFHLHGEVEGTLKVVVVEE
jgi:large subunit ribosomal protein L9